LAYLFFLIVSAGFVYVFYKIPRKQLAPPEILFYWCLGSLLAQNYSALQTMNFKSAMIPDQFSPEFAQLLSRTVLYPILGLLFLHTYNSSKGAGSKLVCMVGFTALMYGFDYLSNALGVFVHITLKGWWSAAFYLLQNLILIGIMKLFRKKLQPGGAHSSCIFDLMETSCRGRMLHRSANLCLDHPKTFPANRYHRHLGVSTYLRSNIRLRNSSHAISSLRLHGQ
jgi:hypothetical protein